MVFGRGRNLEGGLENNLYLGGTTQPFCLLLRTQLRPTHPADGRGWPESWELRHQSLVPMLGALPSQGGLLRAKLQSSKQPLGGAGGPLREGCIALCLGLTRDQKAPTPPHPHPTSRSEFPLPFDSCRSSVLYFH